MFSNHFVTEQPQGHSNSWKIFDWFIPSRYTILIFFRLVKIWFLTFVSVFVLLSYNLFWIGFSVKSPFVWFPSLVFMQLLPFCPIFMSRKQWAWILPPFIIDCPSLEASRFHLCTHKCTAEREATQSPNESSQSRALHHALRLGHEDDLSAFSFTHELGGMTACRIERKGIVCFLFILSC